MSGVPLDFLEAQFQRLVGMGLSEAVAETIVGLYRSGKAAPGDFDMDAFKALHSAPASVGIQALSEFGKLDLSLIQHKSAYLCSMIKNLADQRRGARACVNAGNQPPPEGEKSSETHNATPRYTRITYTAEKVIADPCLIHMHGRGPNEKKIKGILSKVPYTVEVSASHRKYSAPDDVNAPQGNSSGLEVFICRIPRDVFEDELFSIFERCGKILQLRIMLDSMTGLTRGFGFCKFATKESANRAVRRLDEYEMRSGRRIGVSLSLNNQRLFVSNIPKNKDKDELAAEFSKHSPGLVQVIVYTSPDDRKKNRGFCFLDYENHRLATIAKRKFSTGRIRIWSCDIIVDWADPLEEPDEEVMAKVKVLYVRNLTQRVTEDDLKRAFQSKGTVERVKKIKDYAFIHFSAREDAARAMAELQGVEIGGAPMEITWAKPPSDKRKKEELLRKREIRMAHLMYNRGRYWNSNVYGNDRPRRCMVGPPATAGISFTGFTPAVMGNRFSGSYNAFAANPSCRGLYNGPSPAPGLLGSAPNDFYLSLPGGYVPSPYAAQNLPCTYAQLMTAADYWDDFNDLDMTGSPLAPAAVPIPTNPAVPLPRGFCEQTLAQLALGQQAIGHPSVEQQAQGVNQGGASGFGGNQASAVSNVGADYDLSGAASAAFFAGAEGASGGFDFTKFQQLGQNHQFQYPYYV